MGFPQEKQRTGIIITKSGAKIYKAFTIKFYNLCKPKIQIMDEKVKEKIIKLLALRYQAKSKLLGENVKELRAIKRELKKTI